MRVIRPGDFRDERVKALLTRHLEGMHANSPPGHVFALDWSGLQQPEITFYTLWEGEELLGCGALKELDAGSGEIKSMRTADAHLRTGVAAAILDHIIAVARRRGYTRLSLETGSGAAFEPALALYRRRGFTGGAAFGGYEKSPFNQFLHLDLHSGELGMAVHYLEIVSEDVDTMIALYERAHGLAFGPPDPDLGQARVATQGDGTLVGIRKPLAAHEQPIIRTYLAVDDIAHAVTQAGQQGAVIAYPPTRQGRRGTFAIVIHGGVQHGLWQREL